MSLLSSLKKRSALDAAVKLVAKARKNQGENSEQLYREAYLGFASVVADNLLIAEALYHWGFALLHEAKAQDPETAASTLLDAIDKFTFCLLARPEYLGAAIDGGVAYMELARLHPDADKPGLYAAARDFFEKAGAIQKGSSAYNLACIHALNGDEEACLAALRLAGQSGCLPDESMILQDADLASVVDKDWFTEFLAETRENLLQAAAEKKAKTNVEYEPMVKLKKTEDFDYYAK